MRRSLNPRQMYAGIAIGAVVAVIIGALLVVGPPYVARQQNLDAQRVRDLMTISHAVDQFRTTHARLPSTLDELASDPQAFVAVKDPDTQEPYGYRAIAEARYEVCATFRVTVTADQTDQINRFWSHDAGRKCFTLEARAPDRGLRRDGRLP
jgi:type II secretory pathway pseudopilin PulG